MKESLSYLTQSILSRIFTSLFVLTLITGMATTATANSPPEFTSNANPNINEGETFVILLEASDPDGDPLEFKLVEVLDHSDFELIGNQLQLKQEADYETTPSYSIQVEAIDNKGGSDSQLITVNVINNTDERPVATFPAEISIDENTQQVITLTAKDDDGDSIRFGMFQTADYNAFNLNANTGELSLKQPANYEIKPSYQLFITINDGKNQVTKQITITVNDLDETNIPPEFTSIANPSIDEGQTFVITLEATDADNGSLRFSLAGGEDESAFRMNGSNLILNLPADYESKQSYQVVVRVTDGLNTTDQSITVTVNPLNDTAPEFTSADSFAVDEGQLNVATLSATDADGDDVNFSLNGGTDASSFELVGASLRFRSPPNYNQQRSYQVRVQASDGINTTNQTITVNINNLEFPPVFTSPDSPIASENSPFEMTLTATDNDDDPLTYRLVGGADLAAFDLNGDRLSLKQPANFEIKQNYQVIVEVSDGSNQVNQTINLSIRDRNDAPKFTSSANPNMDENSQEVITLTATDEDGDDLEYRIVGGRDSFSFSLFGQDLRLNFRADYETKNTFQVIVQVRDGILTDNQTLNISVNNLNESPPVMTSRDNFTIDENTTFVTTLTATDKDGNTSLTYSLGDSLNSGDFTINGDILSLKSPADFESKQIYRLEVRVSDGQFMTRQSIAVNIRDLNEVIPQFTSSANPRIDEGETFVITLTATDDDDDNDSLTFSLAGGADQSAFTLNGADLSLNDPADFETKASYSVIVQVSDGLNSRNQTITVRVNDSNDSAPQFTSIDNPSIDEGDTFVITLTATDADGDTLTFSLVDGSDLSAFTLNGANLSLRAPADFETKQTYSVIVQVNDGTNSRNQTITVRVNNSNDSAPQFTSSANPSIDEGDTFVITLTATDDDDDNDSLTFSLAGGADQSDFTLNGTDLSLNDPADFETKQTYSVIVQVSDGTNSRNQTITVRVNDSNDSAPQFTSSANPRIDEGETFVITLSATDEDNDPLTFSLAGGEDQAAFTLNGANLSLNNPADFEAQQTYDLIVQVSDGTNSSTQAISVTVNSPDDTAFLDRLNTDANDAAGTEPDANPTAAELNGLSNITGALAANEPAYQRYINANAGDGQVFSNPITKGEIRTLIDTVNANQQIISTIQQDLNDGTTANIDTLSVDEINSIIKAYQDTDTQAIEDNLDFYRNYLKNNPSLFTGDDFEANLIDAVATINALLPSASIHVSQGTTPVAVIGRDTTQVTLSILVDGPNQSSITYSWNITNSTNTTETQTLGTSSDQSFTFTPDTISQDQAEVILTLNGMVNDSTFSRSYQTLLLFADQPSFDTNTDRIPDDQQADSSLNATIQVEAVNSSQPNPVVKVVAGAFARLANQQREDGSASISDYLGKFQGLPEDTEVEHSAGSYNLRILNIPADTNQVVATIALANALTNNLIARKLSTDGTWKTYDNSLLKSAYSGGEGNCDSISDYTNGLTSGNDCVQVTLTDGGEFDLDGEINGSIHDPIGFGANLIPPSSGGSGGGCSLNPSNQSLDLSLLLLLALTCLVISRRRLTPQ